MLYIYIYIHMIHIICMNIRVYLCIYVYVYLSIYLSLYIYIYIYTYIFVISRIRNKQRHLRMCSRIRSIILTNRDSKQAATFTYVLESSKYNTNESDRHPSCGPRRPALLGTTYTYVRTGIIYIYIYIYTHIDTQYLTQTIRQHEIYKEMI